MVNDIFHNNVHIIIMGNLASSLDKARGILVRL